ncbi:hypothetical protein [Moorena sp. SIO3I6]|uniref:hypothetical protein n=1 Tax=Moorena sp. SIO3I6 TaxID=2607831 RepID=UPI0013F7CF36|nr:hypothetical protein [Moorena sp. SIO3I6]NEP25403.1 hypothetical protein [Moorena sp. SIO3I6]
MDVRRKPVNSNDFQKGKADLLQSIEYIVANTTPETRPANLGMQAIPTKNKPQKIFVSYYSEEFLRQIQTIFDTLGGLDAEMVNLKHIARRQSNSLETVTTRINEIKSCYSAIICLPKEEQSEQFNPIAYMDLATCMTLFYDRTLLIYEVGDLPDNLASKVETFKFSGNLDFLTGMELSRKILDILKKGS